MRALGGLCVITIGAIGEANEAFATLLRYFATERASRDASLGSSGFASAVATSLRLSRWRLVAVRARYRLAQLSGRMNLLGVGARETADLAADPAFLAPLDPLAAAALAEVA